MSTAQGPVRRLDRSLPYLSAALAYLVGAVHLFHPDRGLQRLILYGATGNLDLLAHDPRPLAFTLLGIAFLLGPQTAMLPRYRRATYLAGIVATATLFVGYFGWHFTGHGAFLPGRPANPHDAAPLASAIEHLVAYPLARVSKLAEALLFVVLVYRYRRDVSPSARDAD